MTDFNSSLKTGLRFQKSLIPGQSNCKAWCLKNRLPAFQIKRTSRPNAVTEFTAFGIDGSDVNLLLILPADNFYIRTVFDSDGNVFDVIIYTGADDLTNDLPGGEYFIKVADGIEEWWSMWNLRVICYTENFNDVPELEINDLEIGEL